MMANENFISRKHCPASVEVERGAQSADTGFGQSEVAPANSYGLDPLISMADLPPICGLSRASLYRMRSAGAFPAGIKVGPARRLYPAREIRRWLADPAGYRADGS